MNLIGATFAERYEIAEEIGSGGMAVVYKAMDRILNRYVAIKVLRTDLKDDGEFVRRFNIEAQSAASLTHPNIVSIYDVGTEGDFHYIVMEYVKGITLKDYIDHSGALPWREAVDYAIQISKGLEQAHKNAIVHRDIKPHNIIMTGDGTLKITDFGIARASMQSTVTCEDNAIGSVHYVSPEQARGGYVDERSDIYSLGIVLYEMLTGKVPFDNESPVTIALMHLQTKPTPPRELNISIPMAVEEIVLKAISKELSVRYKTVTEMMNDLQRAISESGAASAPEVDELGGAATFTAHSDEEVIYANNQEPSVSSNLIVTPPEKEDEPLPSSDNEPEYEPEEDESMAKKTTKSKKGKKTNTIAIVAALGAALVIIAFLLKILWPYIHDVFFSENTRTFQIPQFINMNYDDATDKYGDIYDFTVEYDEDSDEEDGFILDQDPAPGTSVKRNDDKKIEVILTVSRDGGSSSDEEISSYIGRDYNRVKKELADMDFTVKLEYEYNDRYDEDYIIDQSEAPGTKISDIRSLTLTLSKGKDNSNSNEDDPSPEPNSGDEPDVSSSPSPSPSNETSNRKRLTIYGPTDKDSALVEVKVNGKTIKSAEMSKNSSDVVTIQSALSSVDVEIYHDGVLILTQTVNMTD